MSVINSFTDFTGDGVTEEFTITFLYEPPSSLVANNILAGNATGLGDPLVNPFYVVTPTATPSLFRVVDEEGNPPADQQKFRIQRVTSAFDIMMQGEFLNGAVFNADDLKQTVRAIAFAQQELKDLINNLSGDSAAWYDQQDPPIFNDDPTFTP